MNYVFLYCLICICQNIVCSSLVEEIKNIIIILLIIETLIIILPTKNDWASSCRHVEEVERKYWDADIAVEAEMEKIVIQVTSSDEDTDTATECSDYSDTESADEECLC